MKHLYFCRHGESVYGAEGKFAGSTDTPLSDKGRDQARHAGQGAKDLQIDLIVSSPLSRALETAQIIARECAIPSEKIVINADVRERDYRALEGSPYDPTLVAADHPEVEQDNVLIARAEEALAWLQTQQAETILIVSHGSFGRALRSLCQPQIDFSARIPNAVVVKFL